MGSDKARNSYDATRQYRSVVMQQGRVTVEADWNEAQEIANEETRKDALDFVGPCGTPDDGYRISGTTNPPDPDFDFSVSAGTMYVGGERVELDATVTYDHQSDWLDLTDPDWVDLADLAQNNPTREFIYLYLREQEISAVEDSALRDVALGGPDTAARLRLMQHVVRAAVNATDCAGGLDAATKQWAAKGLTFDPATMRLESNSTLELGFFDKEVAPNPCEPSAQGGYLGAENQLIRVQVSQPNNHKFTWGFDNASFLYRVNVINSQTLELQSAPIDAAHEPVGGQAIEVLLPTARLHNDEYVAAHTGFVTTVSTYKRDVKRISLPAPLPAEFGDGDPNHPHPPIVFLRVWQEELTFTPGTATRLAQTGLQVTLRTTDNGPFHQGDFWQIAARPSTPTKVYPERYLEGPQPADGPRLWACPLALITWNKTVPEITDCRNPFDNLVELTKRQFGGCCTVTLRPQDLKGPKSLQAAVDELKGKGPAKICLAPGVYDLTDTLLISSGNRDLTIEACPGRATIRAAASRQASFTQGLIIVSGAENVTLRGLTLQLPEARLPEKAQDILSGLEVSVGVRPLHCNGLTIEDCEFVFPTTAQQRTLLGAGIFAVSQCAGFRISRNRFLGGNVTQVNTTGASFLKNPPLRLLAGFLQVPTFIGAADLTNKQTVLRSKMLRATLENADFDDNYFERLTAATLILADAGAIRIDGNQVVECYAGFWLLALATLIANANTGNVKGAASGDLANTAAVAGAAALISWDLIIGGLLLGAVRYPLPTDFDAVKAGAVTASNEPIKVETVSIINKVVDGINAHFADVGPPDASTMRVETKTASADQPEFARVNEIRAEMFPELVTAVAGFPPAVFQHQLSLSLDLSHNEVSTVLGTVPWSTAVLIIDTDQNTDSKLTMSSNRLRSQSVSATAGIFFINRCAVTGNLFFNEIAKNPSLFLWAPSDLRTPDATAITGNVFKGPSVLVAKRPDFTPPAPPPMDKWEFFNASVS